MSDENKGKGLLATITELLHMTTETFILIVSVVFVVGASLYFLKNMFFANPVKEIYTNWDDIIYVSEYVDEKKDERMVSITIESVEGMPKGITVSYDELVGSRACPVDIDYETNIPRMEGKTVYLPAHFDSVYGYVRNYYKQIEVD